MCASGALCPCFSGCSALGLLAPRSQRLLAPLLSPTPAKSNDSEQVWSPLGGYSTVVSFGWAVLAVPLGWQRSACSTVSSRLGGTATASLNLPTSAPRVLQVLGGLVAFWRHVLVRLAGALRVATGSPPSRCQTVVQVLRPGLGGKVTRSRKCPRVAIPVLLWLCTNNQ